MALCFFRTMLLYLVLIFSVRLMGKRQIGEMEPLEFVVTMLLANLAAIPMQDGAIPLYSGLVPILTILGGELVLSGLILKSVALRRFLCGRPVILIDNGKLDRAALRRTRLSLDELTGQLREKDVLDIATVQYAILETNGHLSVFPYPAEKPAAAKEAGIRPKPQSLPVTIISDGYVSRENLRGAGKDEAWLHKILSQHGAAPRDTLFLTVDGQDRVFFLGKDGNP